MLGQLWFTGIVMAFYHCMEIFGVQSNMADAVARQQRAATIVRVNNLITRIDANDFQQLNRFELAARSKRFDDLFKQLEVEHRAASMLVDEVERQRFAEEFNDIEDRFVAASAKLQERLEILTKQAADVAAAAAQAAAPAPPAEARPALQYHNIVPTWGKFNGNALEWVGFKARFEASIHNQQMPNPIKFTYLKDALMGEPKQLIGDGPLDEEAYNEAWEKLCKKYERKYPLACAYFNRLQNLEASSEPISSANVQHMSNVASEVKRQLRALEYPVEHWDFVFVQAIHVRLGPLAPDWEEKRQDDDQPTLQKMIDFLDRKAALAQNECLVKPTSLRVTVQNARSASSSQSRPGVPIREKPCGCCGEMFHIIYDCPDFLVQTQEERMATALKKGLCILCLKSGHYKRNCFDKTSCRMPECAADPYHNSMVCPNKGRFTSMHVNTDFPPPTDFANFGKPPVRGRGRGAVFKRLGDRNNS